MNYSELNLLNKVHFIYFKFNLNRGRFDSKSCVFISRILLTVQFNIIFIASLAILEKNYGFLNELAQEIVNKLAGLFVTAIFYFIIRYTTFNVNVISEVNTNYNKKQILILACCVYFIPIWSTLLVWYMLVN